MFCKKSRMFVCVSALAMITALAGGTVNAEIIGTYVDATTILGSTTPNTVPDSAFTSAAAIDDLWRVRTDCGESGTVLESIAQHENSPLLTTTVSGLANGIYDVYAIYWSKDSWRIQAAISGDSLVTYGSTSGTATGATLEGGTILERQVLLGQATVTSGSFAVQIDDDCVSYTDCRARYDGVAYQLIPEPGTLVLTISGLLGLLAYAWRKRK